MNTQPLTATTTATNAGQLLKQLEYLEGAVKFTSTQAQNLEDMRFGMKVFEGQLRGILQLARSIEMDLVDI